MDNPSVRINRHLNTASYRRLHQANPRCPEDAMTVTSDDTQKLKLTLMLSAASHTK
jgi:hypothetical protein